MPPDGPNLPYDDRADAGRALAHAARAFADQADLIVLGLARGGVPVAYEIAAALNAPLDVLLVRKLGVPFQPELAMGAIATGNARVLNQQLIERLNIDPDTVQQVVEHEQAELQRRELAYRGDQPPPMLAHQSVMLVDDGLATGATMRAAVRAVRQHQAAQIIVAVPVAPPDAIEGLKREAHHVICPATPEWFFSVSQWYRHYPQTTDEQVRDLLEQAWKRQRPLRAPA